MPLPRDTVLAVLEYFTTMSEILTNFDMVRKSLGDEKSQEPRI